MKPAIIVWEDACEIDEVPWASHDSDDFVYEPLLVTQVGYILYEGIEGIVVTNGFIEDGQVARRNQIPRGMIKSITYLNTNES